MIPLVTRLTRCVLPTEILIFDVLDVAAVNPHRHECLIEDKICATVICQKCK